MQKVKAVARKNISRFIALDKIKARKKTFSPFFQRLLRIMWVKRHTLIVWVDLTQPMFTLFDQSMFAENF